MFKLRIRVNYEKSKVFENNELFFSAISEKYRENKCQLERLVENVEHKNEVIDFQFHILKTRVKCVLFI